MKNNNKFLQISAKNTQVRLLSCILKAEVQQKNVRGEFQLKPVERPE